MPLSINKITPNQRQYVEINNGKDQPFINWIIAVISLIIVCGWYHILMILFLSSFVYVLPRYILLLLGATLLIEPKLFNRTILNLSIFKYWREYFSFSVVFETLELDNMPLIFGEFPHGVIPVGEMLAQTVMEYYLDKPTLSVTVRSALMTPVWKHLLVSFGCLEATKENILKGIDDNYNMAIIAGGVAEMFRSAADKDVIVLKRRKGFVKIAVERGLDLCPVYYFGQAQIFDFGPKWLEPISRKIRASMGLHYGRFLLPLPRQTEIMCVVGKAIHTKQLSPDDELFDDYVDQVHTQFVEETNNLYTRYSSLYGYEEGTHPLIIE